MNAPRRMTPRPTTPAATAGQPPRRAQRVPLSTPAAAPTQVVNGERTIRTETRQGRNVVSESSRTQTIPREYPAGALGEIRVSHGRTIKTGDFESVRVDVSVTLPCDPNAVQETIAEAHDHVVDAFIAEEEYLIGYANPTPARRGSRRG